MSLFKKRFPTLEEQISRLSPKCRELTDEESRLVNGGGPSVWDTYNGTGCPYEYTTVPKDPPAETTTPTTSTPANKTTEIAESTATDTTNQTPEQETGNATSSPTSISTPVSQTPIADYVRKVINTAFELQKKNFGKEYIEMDYQGQHILVARAGNAKSIEQASQYYFSSGKKFIDSLVIADSKGNLIHKFSNDDAIKTYEQQLNPRLEENIDWWKEIEDCVDLKIGLRADFKSNFYNLFNVGATLNIVSIDSEYPDCFTSGIEVYAALGNEGAEVFALGGKYEKVAYGNAPFALLEYGNEYEFTSYAQYNTKGDIAFGTCVSPTIHLDEVLDLTKKFIKKIGF